jgi:hypothetical protein
MSVRSLDGVEEDVAEFINVCTKVIVPNIADVPIFSDSGKSDRWENKVLEDAVAASTLNEALSVGNNFLYFLVRSMHARAPDRSFTFDFGKGKDPKVQRAIENTEGYKEVLVQTGWKAVMNPEALASIVVTETKSVIGQDVRAIPTYSRPTQDVIQNVRNALAQPGPYVSRVDRANHLITQAGQNRASLAKLKPESREILSSDSLFRTLVQQRKCVYSVMRRSDKAVDNIKPSTFASRDVNEHLTKINITSEAE